MHSSPTTVTTGDAIAEFLKQPEHSEDALSSSETIQEAREQASMMTKVMWKSYERVRWFHSVDIKPWFASMSIIAAALITGVYLFIASLQFFEFQSIPISLPSLWRYGFGKNNPFALVSGKPARNGGTTGLLSRVLFANSFQLLISGSVFLVQTTAYGSGPQGQRIYASDASRIGFSPIGILFGVCAGVVVLAALLGNSFRTYGDVPRSLVRISTSSSGTSALCRPSSEDDEAWLFPVSLGVVSDGGDERLTFSSDVGLSHPLEGSELWLPIMHAPKNGAGG